MVWPEKPPRGQLATVQAVDAYSTLLDGVTTDIVLLTTLGVLHGGGSRTVWKLQDNSSATRIDYEPAGRGSSKQPAASDIRAWARGAGLDVAVRGRLRGAIQQAWRDAHPH